MIFSKCLLFGLDNAGKTSISETVKSGVTSLHDTPSKTISFDTWELSNVTFQIWDVPGQLSLRTLWKKSYYGNDILLFILDTSDDKRYEEAKKEMLGVVTHEESEGLPIIICFHKIDLKKSKDNLNWAKENFITKEIKNRDVYELETSVIKLDTMEKLKETMVLIIKKRIKNLMTEQASNNH